MEGAVVRTQRIVTDENHEVWECEFAAQPGSYVLLPSCWLDVAFDGGLHYCSAGKEGKGRVGGMGRAQARPRRGKGRGAGSASPGRLRETRRARRGQAGEAGAGGDTRAVRLVESRSRIVMGFGRERVDDVVRQQEWRGDMIGFSGQTLDRGTGGAEAIRPARQGLVLASSAAELPHVPPAEAELPAGSDGGSASLGAAGQAGAGKGRAGQRGRARPGKGKWMWRGDRRRVSKPYDLLDCPGCGVDVSPRRGLSKEGSLCLSCKRNVAKLGLKSIPRIVAASESIKAWVRACAERERAYALVTAPVERGYHLAVIRLRPVNEKQNL